MRPTGKKKQKKKSVPVGLPLLLRGQSAEQHTHAPPLSDDGPSGCHQLTPAIDAPSDRRRHTDPQELTTALFWVFQYKKKIMNKKKKEFLNAAAGSL